MLLSIGGIGIGGVSPEGVGGGIGIGGIDAIVVYLCTATTFLVMGAVVE
jgi:hypothetical protein